MTNPTNDANYAEFDEYAEAYSAGMDDPVKALLGRSADDYIRVKTDWLEERFSRLKMSPELHLLDYGCGAGALLRVVRNQGWQTALSGCDISEGMIGVAQKSWLEESGPMPKLTLQSGSSTVYYPQSFDFIVVSAVLHHVPPDDRSSVIAEIKRILKPSGIVIIFEHNPRNPVTKFIVARTPIDRNAILLSPRETENLLSSQGFSSIKTEYLMFTPPSTSKLRSIDKRLRWFPLGAQYATYATISE